VDCAFSGGADSTALLILASAAGLAVTAHHVDHGLRPESGRDADRAVSIAAQLGIDIEVHTVSVGGGPNMEDRARRARAAVLPAGTLTGHTADDQAETVLLRLLRGAGTDGLGGIRPGPTHPLLAVRRHDTEQICRDADIEWVHDTSNDDLSIRRNAVRHRLLPLIAEIAERDPVPLLTRTAAIARDDAALLDQVVADHVTDPTDTRALAALPQPIAVRALRAWLTHDGYPPDAAAIERVLDVVHHRRVACELPGGRRVARSGGFLHIITPDELAN